MPVAGLGAVSGLPTKLLVQERKKERPPIENSKGKFVGWGTTMSQMLMTVKNAPNN